MNWLHMKNSRPRERARWFLGGLLFTVGLLLIAQGWQPVRAGHTPSRDPGLPSSTSGSTVPSAINYPDSGVTMDWQVMAISVSIASSNDYAISLTGGESAVGMGSSENYGVSGGFWIISEEGGCCRLRGDVNHDGAPLIDIADLVWLVDYMFTGGPEPPCWDEGDIDASGQAPIDVSDLVYLVDFMFTGGPEPPPCP